MVVGVWVDGAFWFCNDDFELARNLDRLGDRENKNRQCFHVHLKFYAILGVGLMPRFFSSYIRIYSVIYDSG